VLPPAQRAFSIGREWFFRVRPVVPDVMDCRHLAVRKVARQLGLHASIVDRNRGRQAQRVAVTLFPQAVDHRSHQAQYTARALERHQRRPVAVKPIENLRVDRVRGLDALLVVAALALGRELGALRVIEVGEGVVKLLLSGGA
jgi:hypothetical protein